MTTVTRASIARLNPGAVFADGLDDALVGYAYVNDRHVALYSVKKVISVLVDRDGMSEDDAWEYYEFNIVGAYVGPDTPIFYEFPWERDEPKKNST